MTEEDFRKYVYFLAKLHAAGKFTALETGRKLHDVACRYLQDHETLPRGYEGFDY
jgi:hypothetical protein